eukprot:5426792-Pleurochrysis_carterae.AAC.1
MAYAQPLPTMMMHGDLPIAQAVPIQAALPVLPYAEPDENMHSCQPCLEETHSEFSIADTLGSDPEGNIPIFDEEEAQEAR